MPAPRRPRLHAGGQPRVANVAESPADVWDVIGRGVLDDDDPPPACDLRRPWYRIGDQGETGSCIGWALADSVMRWMLVDSGRLDERERLSVRFIWMASKEWQAQRLGREQGDLTALLGSWQPSTFLDEATTVAKDALEVARHLGVVPEPMLRFDGRLNRGPEAAFWTRAADFKLAAYYRVGGAGREERIRRWRQWLAQRGPLMLVLEIDRGLRAGDKDLMRFRRRSRRDLHALALVGYTEDRFIMRNSWGTGWADKGYALATPEWLAAAVRESYGVVF